MTEPNNIGLLGSGRRIVLDDGESAGGEIGREEAHHGAAAEPEKQNVSRFRHGGDGQRHDPLVGEDELFRMHQAHRRLLRHEAVLAQRGEVAADIAAAWHIDHRQARAEGGGIAFLKDLGICAEKEGEMVTMPHRADPW